MYATYNITDDKLRLHLGHKPGAAENDAMRKAGFSYWHGSKLNVSKWSTAAEDYILSLGLEIITDDTPDDVESRVERFSGYAENAVQQAERASDYAHGLLSGIPAGQPVQAGHHSEQRHRSTLKRADNAMRRFVSESERAAHWEYRKAAAIAHARYKEQPSVISRRIKGLEADKRKFERELDDKSRAEILANVRYRIKERISKECEYDAKKVKAYVETHAEELQAEATATFEKAWTSHEKWANRWLAHIREQLEYQNALLEAMGGNASNKWEFSVGGQVKCADEWYTILRINRKAGEIVSLTTNARRRIKLVGQVLDYLPPSEEDTAKAKAKVKQPPLCNYLGENFVSIAQEEWDKQHADYKGTRVISATATTEAHRVRVMYIKSQYPFVFISDAKEKKPASL